MQQSLIFDLSDPATLADPFPLFRRLREDDPVHWSPSLKSWIFTRYEDVKRAHMTPALSPDRITPFYDSLPEPQRSTLSEVVRYLRLWMVFRDPPEHTRLRKLVGAAFTPAAIETLAPAVEAIVDRLLSALDPSEPVDLVTDLAAPLPALVIMKILGVPDSMLPELKAWSDDLMVFIGSARGVSDKYERAQIGSQRMAGYFRRLIAERRTAPEDDILSRMITAQEDGEQLSDDELIATCMMLLFAGHETTTNMISSALLQLHRHPDQRAGLQNAPETIETALEELLRYDGPSNAIGRVVIVEHELEGKALTAGSRVFAFNSAANRDPGAFDLPEALDLTRQGNRHLTFGYGLHFCLGAALARLEGKLAIPSFLARFPDFRCLDQEPLAWIDSVNMRGLQALPTRLS